MKEVNKNTEVDNTDKKLHISDVSDSKIKLFAKKISSRLTSSDYRGLYSKDCVINLLKGYGYSINKDDVNDNNWEELYDILTDV
jgi:hypothetical protein